MWLTTQQQRPVRHRPARRRQGAAVHAVPVTTTSERPTTAPAPDVAALLRAVLPADVVLDDPDVLASYAADQSQLTASGAPSAVVVPRTTAQVSAALRVAHEHGLPVVPRGAGSGLSGGANCPDGAVVLSLHRMDAVLRVDAVDRVAVVQPGVVTAALREAAQGGGPVLPARPRQPVLVHGRRQRRDQRGGHVLRAPRGHRRPRVLELEVVLADGRVLRLGRSTVKDVAGLRPAPPVHRQRGRARRRHRGDVAPAGGTAPGQATLVAGFDGDVVAAGAGGGRASSPRAQPTLVELMDGAAIVRAVEDLTRMGLDTSWGALLLLQCDEAGARTGRRPSRRGLHRGGRLDWWCLRAKTLSRPEQLLAARRLALPAFEAHRLRS